MRALNAGSNDCRILGMQSTDSGRKQLYLLGCNREPGPPASFASRIIQSTLAGEGTLVDDVQSACYI